ncbi:MAG: UDP-N-acetylmuramoyl-tripeptide--D-alanyl-D-alanine ligase [Anaerolineaceae bacterium]
MIKLTDLFRSFDIKINGCEDALLSEATIDSRRVIPGSLFFALKGERVDGHTYIPQAIAAGAQVVILDQEITCDFPVFDLKAINQAEPLSIPSLPFGIKVKDALQAMQKIAAYLRKSRNLKVIGITGSVGKSSTKELVAEVLGKRFAIHKNPGNYNNEIGLPLTLMNCGYGQEYVVLEMGFYYPGEIKFLCEIASPEIGIVTNIGTVHAERAGSQQIIAEGKAELVEALPDHGVAILNYDDPFVRPMSEKTRAKVLFYGLSPAADLWADAIQGNGLKGITFDIHYQGLKYHVQVPLLGRHSVQTILRSAAAGLAVGMTWDEIILGLQKGHSQLRLVAVRTETGALILDDTYNATPESMLAALDLLDELRGHKVAVLGDMLELGAYEELGHHQVGEKAATVVNHLITVGKLGRIIADTARQAGLPENAITSVNNSAEAVEILKYNLTAEDVVLIKGSHGLRMDTISAALEKTR